MPLSKGRLAQAGTSVILLAVFLFFLLDDRVRMAIQVSLTPLWARFAILVGLTAGFYFLAPHRLAPWLYRVLRAMRSRVISLGSVRWSVGFAAITVVPVGLYVLLALLADPETTALWWSVSLLGVLLVAAPVVWLGAWWLELFLSEQPEDRLRRMVRGEEPYDETVFEAEFAAARRSLQNPATDPIERWVRRPRMEALVQDLRDRGRLDPEWAFKDTASRVTIADWERRLDELLAEQAVLLQGERFNRSKAEIHAEIKQYAVKIAEAERKIREAAPRPQRPPSDSAFRGAKKFDDFVKGAKTAKQAKENAKKAWERGDITEDDYKEWCAHVDAEGADFVNRLF